MKSQKRGKEFTYQITSLKFKENISEGIVAQIGLYGRKKNHSITNLLALTKIISKDHFSFQARGGIGVGFQEYFKRNFWHH